jgi:hypothetical protein
MIAAACFKFVPDMFPIHTLSDQTTKSKRDRLLSVSHFLMASTKICEKQMSRFERKKRGDARLGFDIRKSLGTNLLLRRRKRLGFGSLRVSQDVSKKSKHTENLMFQDNPTLRGPLCLVLLGWCYCC